MNENEHLKATLEWEGRKVEFKGSPEEVWRSINRFLSETNPKIASLADFIIKVNPAELLEKLKGIIQIDKDVGPVVPTDVNIAQLNDTERTVFVLLVRRITCMTNYTSTETMNVEEVEKESKAKSAGVLLSQLTTQKIVQNVAEPGKKGSYRITDYGIQWFISKSLKKLQGKTE